MVQFDATRKTLPGFDMSVVGNRKGPDPARGTDTGAAWLSSARVVRCWVKSRNERNPYLLLLTGEAEDSAETAGDKPEEGGDDVKSSWSLRPGPHTCYNGRDKPLRTREGERIG